MALGFAGCILVVVLLVVLLVLASDSADSAESLGPAAMVATLPS